ncbi:Mobile element protein [Richelia intracellularis]|nr:Mobile element protein [Richelia intracellularis]
MRDDFTKFSSISQWFKTLIHPALMQHRYWQITTDPQELPKNTTWYVMSKYPDITPREVGNFYGLRTWVEYGLKKSKNELGWADF